MKSRPPGSPVERLGTRPSRRYGCAVNGDRRYTLVATCSRGLEEVLRSELVALGHPEAACGRGMVRFAGGREAVLRANLHLRTAMRVLVGVAEGPALERDALYDLAAGVRWEDIIGPGQTIAVSVAGRGGSFVNPSFAALVVKDAVSDRLRGVRGQRASVDRADPSLRIHVHLAAETCSIALDSSGEPLSHRGYRPRGGPAPLSEALAAGVLLLAGYDGSQPLLDPFCGTGTIAIEAALIATRSAPGLGRRFAVERWWGHDPQTTARVREEARSAVRPAPAPIRAADVDARAVRATARNAREAGVGAVVGVERRDFRDLVLPGEGTLIVANPPYGERLGDVDTMRPLYRSLGDTLKQRGAGCVAWLLVGNPELAKEIGLRASRRIPLFNGPIECRLLRIDLFRGPARRR